MGRNKNHMQARLPYLQNGDWMTAVSGPHIGGKLFLAALFVLVSLALALATIPSYWYQITTYTNGSITQYSYYGTLFNKDVITGPGGTTTIHYNNSAGGDFAMSMFGLSALALFWVAIPLLAGAIRSCCCKSDGGLVLGLRTLRRVRTKLMFTLLFQVLGTAWYTYTTYGTNYGNQAPITQCVSTTAVGGCGQIGSGAIQSYYIGFGTAIAAIAFSALACWLSFTMYEDNLHFALTNKAASGGQYHALAVGVFTDADTEDNELSNGALAAPSVMGNPAVGLAMPGTPGPML